jgi:HD-GYP domain-containing protein (c-di-GMP phosphodiesterase class II)
LPTTNASPLDEQLATAQALKYAEELRELHAKERAHRKSLEQALEQLNDSYGTTVRALAAALELRDDGTGEHAGRVSGLAMRLTRAVAPALMSDPELEFGFLLHDLGKIGVPDAILLKPGRLTPDEVERMRVHTILGERIVAQIPYLSGLAREVVAYHHERWDGGGYPYRLRGNDIPPAARIFALVDAWDAMTNDRPYRRALPFETAASEIRAGVGSQFDPDLAAAFLSLLPELRSAA